MLQRPGGICQSRRAMQRYIKSSPSESLTQCMQCANVCWPHLADIRAKVYCLFPHSILPCHLKGWQDCALKAAGLLPCQCPTSCSAAGESCTSTDLEQEIRDQQSPHMPLPIIAIKWPSPKFRQNCLRTAHCMACYIPVWGILNCLAHNTSHDSSQPLLSDKTFSTLFCQWHPPLSIGTASFLATLPCAYELNSA